MVLNAKGYNMISSSAVVPPDLMKAALDLPQNVRGLFASLLIESLDDELGDPETLRHEWREELTNRIDDIENGKVELVDGHATLLRYERELKSRLGE